MDWKYAQDAIATVRELKTQGYVIICAEQVQNSTKLNEAKFTAKEKYVVVLGSEVDGVNQQIINLADYCVEIPQAGTKHSLNISVAAGIIGWEVFRQLH